MEKVLKISSVAALVGVSQKDVQEHIADGSLSTVCGRVFFSDLVQIYPHLKYEDVSIYAKMDRINRDAVVKTSVEDGKTRNVGALQDELHNLENQISYWQQQTRQFKQMLKDVSAMLKEPTLSAGEKGRLVAIAMWIDSKL